MTSKSVKCGQLNISNTNTFTLIAGPCQLENEKHALDVASKLKKITDDIRLTQYTESFTNLIESGVSTVLTKSTSIWLPVFNKGPNIGKTSQLTKAGGNSMNQSKPWPEMYLVKALADSAKTIIEIIAIAIKNVIFVKIPLKYCNGQIILLIIN